MDRNTDLLHLLDGLRLQYPLPLCFVVLVLRVMEHCCHVACSSVASRVLTVASLVKGTVATCRRCLSVCTVSCSASTIVSKLRTCTRRSTVGCLALSALHADVCYALWAHLLSGCHARRGSADGHEEREQQPGHARHDVKHAVPWHRQGRLLRGSVAEGAEAPRDVVTGGKIDEVREGTGR